MRFVLHFNKISYFCVLSTHFNLIFLLKICNLLYNVQEIKFEPCVMCEHLEKRTSFRLSQVGVILFYGVLDLRWHSMMYIHLCCFACRLKMAISYAFRKHLLLKVKRNADIRMFLHFWNMCTIDR